MSTSFSPSAGNWQRLPLADAGTWVGGGTPSKAEPRFWANGTVPWVSPKDMRVDRIDATQDSITEEAIQRSTTNTVEAGAILVVVRSGILRHTLPVAVAGRRVAINQDLKAVTPKPGIEPRFLALALHTFADEILATCTKAGTTVQNIDFQRLLRFEIPLASPEEQRTIVEEIEKQLTRLDAGVAALKAVQTNLKRYRAAVLKAACEGRLVPTEAELARREGRSYEPASVLVEAARTERARLPRRPLRDRHAQPPPPTDATLASLPEGWAWARWEDIGTSQNGRPFPSKQYAADGVRLLRPGNLHESGRVEWTLTNTRFLPPVWAEKNPDLMIGPGELVMNLTAQSLKDEFLGRVCQTGPNESCLLNQRIARLTPLVVSHEYCLWIFKSPLFRRFVDRLNTGSLIQHMFTSQLGEFWIPIAPLAEQHRIVAEAERRLSLADDLDRAVAADLDRVARLRQSVLAAAFGRHECAT